MEVKNIKLNLNWIKYIVRVTGVPSWVRCPPHTGRETSHTSPRLWPRTGQGYSLRSGIPVVCGPTCGILIREDHMEVFAPRKTSLASSDWAPSIRLRWVWSRYWRRCSTPPDIHLHISSRQEFASGSDWGSVWWRMLWNCSRPKFSSISVQDTSLSSLFLLFLPMMLMICILRKNVTIASPPIL